MTLHWATLREPPCQMNLAKLVAEKDPLSNVVIVLNRPKDVVNIAGVIRGMMNMGLSRLRLVEPDEAQGASQKPRKDESIDGLVSLHR